jgi:T3SS (YopN, CesT) and YbjN peptide-binding chaperone 3
MSKQPKDLPQNPAPAAAAPHTSQLGKQGDPGAGKETIVEKLRRGVANDPRFKEAKSPIGFMLFGDPVHEQLEASAIKTEATALRPGEPPLGMLSPDEQSWLTSAIKCLVQIEDYRKGKTTNKSGHCIFEVGSAYVQFQAPNHANDLICEAVSGELLPDIAAILTSEKIQRLVREFGFVAPRRSPNFAQRIAIESRDDLAYAARLAYRLFRDVYDVTSFDGAKFKLWPPKAVAVAAPEIRKPTSRKFVLTIDKQPLTLKLEAILGLFGKARTIEFSEGRWAPVVSFGLDAPLYDMPTVQHIDFSRMSQSEIVAALMSIPEDIADFAGFVRNEIEAIEKAQSDEK